jgi:hypothetical protein
MVPQRPPNKQQTEHVVKFFVCIIFCHRIILQGRKFRTASLRLDRLPLLRGGTSSLNRWCRGVPVSRNFDFCLFASSPLFAAPLGTHTLTHLHSLTHAHTHTHTHTHTYTHTYTHRHAHTTHTHTHTSHTDAWTPARKKKRTRQDDPRKTPC